MLEGYFDESGINPSDAYCVVAGFVGSSRQWQLFEERWIRASGGVTFHGKEFFARDQDGQRVKTYRGWTDERAAKYLDGLLSVIEQTTVKPVGVVVEVPAFMALTATERKFLTGRMFHRRKDKWVGSGTPDKAFFWAFNECLPRIADCVRKPGWKVHVVFDRQQQYAGHALKLFQDNKQIVSGLGDRLGDLSFKEKTGIGGLQAADLLAHACYRRGRIRRVGDSPELDMATARLRPVAHKRIALLNAEAARRSLDAVPPEVKRALKWA